MTGNRDSRESNTGYGDEFPDMLEDDDPPEPECECIQIDVDLVDATYCKVHGV